MIFKPVLIKKILVGDKTVTRRPLKTRKCKYVVGKTYGIQPGMARPSIARIRITSVEAVWLGDVNDAEARLEGFEDAEAFFGYWAGLYPDTDVEGVLVWRIGFRLVEALADLCGCCDGSGVMPYET